MTDRPLSLVANELLVLRCQAADERALAILYERWHPRLARHILRITGNRESVADVSQDAWLGIVRGIRRLDDPARFPAWAYRIAHGRAVDWIRRRARTRTRTSAVAPETLSVSSVQPPDGDDAARLRAALEALSPEHRAVIGLHYGDGLGLRDVARVVGVSVGTVKSRLHHARRQLGAILERNEP